MVKDNVFLPKISQMFALTTSVHLCKEGSN